MKPTGAFIRVVSGFYFGRKLIVNRIYNPMTSIPVPGQSGTIIPLQVVPAADGSGTYVWVVSLQDASIDVGTVDIALTYNLDPPALENTGQTGFQGDINGNLKVAVAQPLPVGTNVIGAVDQGTGGSSPWKVDPSGVTSPVTVESMPSLPTGTNTVGGVYQVPTSSSSAAITPGASSVLEAGHVLKSSAGNLYSLYVLSTEADGYLMTFDATSIPSDGAVDPVECLPVFAGSSAIIDFAGSLPDRYSVGLVAVFSTTGPFTKTGSETAFFKWRVQ